MNYNTEEYNKTRTSMSAGFIILVFKGNILKIQHS